MRLKPFASNEEALVTEVIEKDTAISDILSMSGIEVSKKDKEKQDIRNIFTSAGAGIKDIAKVTAAKMRTAESDQTQLKAAEFAARVHGLLEDLEKSGNQIPVINITINGQGSLVNLLIPQG